MKQKENVIEITKPLIKGVQYYLSHGTICPIAFVNEENVKAFIENAYTKDNPLINDTKALFEAINIAIKAERENILKDLKTAKQCLNFKGYTCDNKDCLNLYCPLNKKRS